MLLARLGSHHSRSYYLCFNLSFDSTWLDFQPSQPSTTLPFLLPPAYFPPCSCFRHSALLAPRHEHTAKALALGRLLAKPKATTAGLLAFCASCVACCASSRFGASFSLAGLAACPLSAVALALASPFIAAWLDLLPVASSAAAGLLAVAAGAAVVACAATAADPAFLSVCSDMISTCSPRHKMMQMSQKINTHRKKNSQSRVSLISLESGIRTPPVCRCLAMSAT